MNLVAPKAAAMQELLFIKPTSGIVIHCEWRNTAFKVKKNFFSAQFTPPADYFLLFCQIYIITLSCKPIVSNFGHILGKKTSNDVTTRFSQTFLRVIFSTKCDKY